MHAILLGLGEVRDICAATPRPWPDSLVSAWIRAGLIDPRMLWLPDDAPPTLRKAIQAGRIPGRQALALVAGGSEKRARYLLNLERQLVRLRG